MQNFFMIILAVWVAGSPILYYVVRDIRFLTRAKYYTVPITGTVCDYASKGRLLAPVIRYPVGDGFCQGAVYHAYSLGRFRIGQEVDCLYDPDAPSEFILAREIRDARYNVFGVLVLWLLMPFACVLVVAISGFLTKIWYQGF